MGSAGEELFARKWAEMLGISVEQVEVAREPAPWSRPQQCYHNSYTYLMRNKRGTYVLGYVCVCGIPLDHAWVHIDGRHIDPTLGDDPAVGSYFKSAELTMRELRKMGWKRMTDEAISLCEYRICKAKGVI